MDSARWQQVEAVLAAALERTEDELGSFLDARCAGDADLRAEVESLVRASARGARFFERLGGDVEALQEASLGAIEELTAGAHIAVLTDPAGEAAAWKALEAEIGDRYRIESLIDKGGMGLVFRAVDRKHGRPVAIKTVHPQLAEGLDARFEREIRITANLQHPNILPLLDSGVAGETLYYLMPFVEGESLKARLDREGRLTAGEATRIAIDVADGLAHAHGRGVLHRDVKPSNILLAEGHVQIVDFGIARAVVEIGKGHLTAPGLGLGTPNYMAPEQYAGESTSRSDVYSLGAVLYEALTGRVWRIESAAGRPSWQHVPGGLQPVIERALEEAPAERWAEVGELASALHHWHQAHAAGRGDAPPKTRRGVLARMRRRLSQKPSPSADAKSVAVLPFANLTGDPETEYFSDGITEDITSHLSRIRELKVISRTSVMRFKDADTSIPKIGRQLGVGSVLEGSVRRQGDRVRVVAQLVDARSGEHVWSETYDRELTDIFEIQSEVAQRIASALSARMSDTERSLIRRRPTEDVEAHDLYLKGRHLWMRRTQTALESAEEQFKRAVARDPMFAPAYAGLADVYLLLAGYGYRPELETLHKARVSVDRALELDERLAEAHASRGQILRSDRDWAGEEREYLRAIEINPNYATAHQWYATLLSALGRQDEAMAEIERAADLDPLSHAIRVTSGILRCMGNDYDGALADFERTRQLEPRFFSAPAWELLLWSHLGDHERAMEAWSRLRELHPDPRLTHFSLAYVHAVTGDREEALAALESDDGVVPDHGWKGLVRAQLGDTDEAFRLLEAALSDESWRLFVLQRSLLFYIKVGPWFDPLRDDPRFEGLLRRMNMSD